MPYCTNCGHEVSPEMRFCPSCGKSTDNSADQVQVLRNRVFEGDIRSCPACGHPLDAFDLECPACGHEIRNRVASTAVQNFAKEIAELEAERDSTIILTPKGTEDDKPSKNARRKAREQIDRKIASYIQNFPIPNTKEDLFEFLILSSSNISEDRYSNRISKGQKAISDAWKSKFEQAYQKAKISFGKTPEFEEIKVIYEEKQKDEDQIKKAEEQNKKRVERKKLTESIFWGGGTIVGFIVLIAVMIVSFRIIDKASEAENLRLEAIVDEIYECIDAENYVLARAKTASLVFSGSNKSATEKWEKTRREMYAIIDRAEGIEPGTVPDIQDVAGTNYDTSIVEDEPEEEKSEGFFSSVVNGVKDAFGF